MAAAPRALGELGLGRRLRRFRGPCAPPSATVQPPPDFKAGEAAAHPAATVSGLMTNALQRTHLILLHGSVS